MAYFCFKCSAQLASGVERGKTARSESCPKCSSDLHCCRNCKFYDRTAYNECREPQADRVVDKERSNFCDYFSFTDKASAGATGTPAKDPLKELDALFKK